MKNTTKAIASFIVTVVIALLACTLNVSETVITVLMMLTLVTGGAFVYFVNLETNTDSAGRKEATVRENTEDRNAA